MYSCHKRQPRWESKHIISQHILSIAGLGDCRGKMAPPESKRVASKILNEMFIGVVSRDGYH